MTLCGQQIMPDDPADPPRYCARLAIKELGVCREHAQPVDQARLDQLINPSTTQQDGR